MTLPGSQGLWRTVLAGPGGSLAEAFDNLERSAQVRHLQRHPERGLTSARVLLTPEEGQGYWELMRIRADIYVILTNCAYRDPRFELVPGDGLVQFNFRVSGDMTYGIARPLRFNRPALHIWRQPAGIDMREWTAPSSHEQMICISVRPDFLREYFFCADASIPPRLQAFVAAQASQIDWCQMPLTGEMMDTIGKLLNNPYTGVLSLVYVESLTLGLLCAAVGHFSTLPQRPTEQYSEVQLRALQNARELVMKRLTPLPTGKRIARTVGLAQKTLYSGFRAVYGETLNEFTRKCRMQHALSLLRERHWSVDRVSEAVGYAHPTTFTAAFRRHFGLRPVDFKRKSPRK